MTRLASRLDAASPEAGAVPPPRPAAPVDTATPAPPRPAAAPAEPWSDVEGVVGRYGVLALGTVTTLAAVGTFVSWAAYSRNGPTSGTSSTPPM